jgi:hypothetical protein
VSGHLPDIGFVVSRHSIWRHTKTAFEASQWPGAQRLPSLTTTIRASILCCGKSNPIET